MHVVVVGRFIDPSIKQSPKQLLTAAQSSSWCGVFCFHGSPVAPAITIRTFISRKCVPAKLLTVSVTSSNLSFWIDTRLSIIEMLARRLTLKSSWHLVSSDFVWNNLNAFVFPLYSHVINSAGSAMCLTFTCNVSLGQQTASFGRTSCTTFTFQLFSNITMYRLYEAMACEWT